MRSSRPSNATGTLSRRLGRLPCPTTLDRLTPEQRNTLYHMLRLEMRPTEEGYEITGPFVTEPLCTSEPLPSSGDRYKDRSPCTPPRRLGVASEQDAGCAIGQQDGHGVVVDLGEQTAFCVRRRSYNVRVGSNAPSPPPSFSSAPTRMAPLTSRDLSGYASTSRRSIL